MTLRRVAAAHEMCCHAAPQYKMLPLHLGVRYEASETVITMLLQAFPEGSKAGWTGDVRYYVRSTDSGPFEATVR